MGLFGWRRKHSVRVLKTRPYCSPFYLNDLPQAAISERAMTDPKFRAKLKEEELQAVIMARLCKHEECSGIIQVYVRPTGDQPPAHTWVHVGVAAHDRAEKPGRDQGPRRCLERNAR